MFPVTSRDAGIPVGGSMGVKYLCVQVHFLKMTSPKAVHSTSDHERRFTKIIAGWLLVGMPSKSFSSYHS